MPHIDWTNTTTATWAGAVAVLFATAVALFQDWLRALVWHPTLKVYRTPGDRWSAHKTAALAPDGEIPCYYYRLLVGNDGRAAARNVELFLTAAYRKPSAEVLEPVERFLPQWLCWATIRNLDEVTLISAGPTGSETVVRKALAGGIYLPILPPKARRYFDLGHVLNPKDRVQRPYEDDPAMPRDARDEVLLSLDAPVTYLRRGHLLRPGRYVLLIEVAAANAKPRVFEVEVTNGGKWYDKEEEMLAHGVTVNDVRPHKPRAFKKLLKP
jgi:hypothetical protein